MLYRNLPRHWLHEMRILGLSKPIMHGTLRRRCLAEQTCLRNLRQRPIRTGLSVLAIGVEVTMILTLVEPITADFMTDSEFQFLRQLNRREFQPCRSR